MGGLCEVAPPLPFHGCHGAGQQYITTEHTSCQAHISCCVRLYQVFPYVMYICCMCVAVPYIFCMYQVVCH
jgi:hypothetical protein